MNVQLANNTDRKAKFEKYFTHQIFLGRDKWLVFKRHTNFNGIYENEAIELKLQDEALHTTTLLGILCNGRWESPNSRSANELWSIVKKHRKATNRALHKLTTPLADLRPFVFEWNCFKRRFQLQSIKIKRKIKSI